MSARLASAEDPAPDPGALALQGTEPANPRSSWPLAASVALAASLSAAVAVAVWPPESGLAPLGLTIVLVLAAAISGGMTFRAEGNFLQPAPTLLYVTSAAIVLGPLAAALAGAFAGGRSIPRPRQARVFAAGLGGLQGVAVTLVVRSFGGASLHLHLVVECAAAALVGGCVWVAGQTLVCVVRKLPDPAARLRRADLPSTGADVLVAVATAPSLILLYRDTGIVPLVVFIGVLIAAFGLFLAYRAKLLDLNAEVERLSRTDPLTGAANRRAFEQRLDHELHRLARTGSPFGLLLIDVDRFKQLNDGYGHGAGDRVLAELGRRLTGRLREEDLLARIGGDEFAAIVTNVADAAALETLAHDLRRVAADTPFEWLQDRLRVAISAGAALAEGTATTPEGLLREADRALYADKARGRSPVLAAGA